MPANAVYAEDFPQWPKGEWEGWYEGQEVAQEVIYTVVDWLHA